MAAIKCKVDVGSGLAAVSLAAPPRAAPEMIIKRLGAIATAQFAAYLTATTDPYRIGQNVAITSDDGATLYFNGTITAHTARTLAAGATKKIVDITCEGDEALLDEVRITRHFPEQAAGTSFTDINTTDLGSLFTTSGVDAGPVLPAFFLDDVTAREAFARIKQMAGPTWHWSVDAASLLTFKEVGDASAAAWSFAADTQFFNDRTFSVGWRPSRFYNEVVFYGKRKQSEEITETIVKDGLQTLWPFKLAYGKGGTDNVSVSGGSTFDLEVRGVVQDHTSPTAFIGTPGTSDVTRQGDIGGVGDKTVDFTYTPITKLIYAYRNQISVDRLGGFPSGLFTSPPVRALDAGSIADLASRAHGYLDAHARQEYPFIGFDTSTIYSGITVVEPGQTQAHVFPSHAIDHAFVITSVVMTAALVGSEDWNMRIECAGDYAPPDEELEDRYARSRAVNTDSFTAMSHEAEEIVKTRTENLEISVVGSVADV